MGLIDGIRSFLALEPYQTRSAESPDTFEELLARLRPVRLSPWRPASTREAMGVPAVFKAVSLISNTTGTLSMEAYRNGAKLADFDTPRLIVRPDPTTTPYTFWRQSAYFKARYGETWWWTAKRDFDGAPLSLIPIDPRQIIATENPRDYFRPFIDWTMPSGQVRRMPNEDMTWLPYLIDPNNRLRGWGPLQACGAAVSVAVEAQEWAANFFAGNPATTWIKYATGLTDDEAALVKERWMSGASNLPKVTDDRVEDVKDIGTDPDKAQLSDMRLFQNGEVALMFSMPPSLLNFAVQGSTITYQNVGQVADDLLRQCLLPHYLEPMEQAMSDLLARSTVGRFNVFGLTRADIKTRADVHNILVPLGVETVEEARQIEGFAPGDVENRPVPFAAPSASPPALPTQTRSAGSEVRCSSCHRLLAEMATAPFRFTCPKCKAVTSASESEVQGRTMVDAMFALANREQAPIVIPPATINVAPPNVNVTTPDVVVNMPAQPINIKQPDITVNVAAPEAVPQQPMTVNLTVPPAVVGGETLETALATAQVAAEEQLTRQAAQIEERLATFSERTEAMLDQVETTLSRPINRRVIRDPRGQAIGIEEDGVIRPVLRDDDGRLTGIGS